MVTQGSPPIRLVGTPTVNTGLLARLGDFVFRHARLVLVVSGVLVAVAAVVGAGAFSKLQGGGFQDPRSESAQAARQITSIFGGGANLVLLVHVDSGSVDSPEGRATGIGLALALAAEPTTREVSSYWSTGAPGMKSKDGRDAIVLARVKGTGTQVDDNTAVLISKYASRRANEGKSVTVRAGGGVAVSIDTNDEVSKSLIKAEAIAVPITLILLALAFGSLVAAAVPLVIGGVAIAGTFAELAILGSLTDVSVFSINLTTALGLALGIDYALFMVSRLREQLAHGDEIRLAVVGTVRTAGRTIVFSSATVAVALAALLLFPMPFLHSFAYAGIGVVLIAAIAALTITPAMLAVLGPRINAGRLPWSKSVRDASSPVWGRLAAAAMRRPVLSAVPVIAVLLVAASPLLNVSFTTPDERVLTTSVPSRQVSDTLRAEFAGKDNTSTIEILATGATDGAALSSYARQLSRLPGIDHVSTSLGAFTGGTSSPTVPADTARGMATAQHLSAVLTVDRDSDVAQQLVGDVRSMTPPTGTTVLVGGAPAELVDTKASIMQRLPLAGLWIVLTTFILLFLFTGSVVQPLRALLVNGLTILATLGVMSWIFLDGHLASALNFTPRPMDTAMTVLLFCITFGLCMDYEVFVTSRIQELHEAGHDLQASASQGLARTGRIVSTAAGLMAVNFLAFGTSSVSFLQMFGLGAGLAVLIDATLVRGILVPAVMRIVGPGIWYAPDPLRRLHERIGLRES